MSIDCRSNTIGVRKIKKVTKLMKRFGYLTSKKYTLFDALKCCGGTAHTYVTLEISRVFGIQMPGGFAKTSNKQVFPRKIIKSQNKVYFRYSPTRHMF